ncbi:MAG: class I SAM-dependent methyltransferase [Myxococcales bacterium]|nr:MAG: class I SAM-dependent methyltransferase [Myxococcales bacterium]
MLLDRIFQVLDDRSRKQAMASADYWDERARTRSGFARSVWHSETFSQAWDARQQEVLRAALGPVAGLRVADVGCGTGRISRFLAREGAIVTGFDFSPTTVEAARDESAGVERLTFEVADATSGQLPVAAGTFDVLLTVGCLAVACRDLGALRRSFEAMAGAAKPGGRVALLEPIHDNRVVGRVLREPVQAWVDQAHAAGLTLVQRRGMGFLPVRMLLSSLDAPSWLVEPVFGAGERLLEAGPLEITADYRLLVFRAPGA